MKFTPSPTGKAFIRDRSYIKLIMGPVGGGKSTVCLMDLLSRANNQTPFNGLRRTKFGILRNTAAQLKSTVKPMIDEWLVTIPQETQGRAVGQWRLTDNTFEITGELADGTRMHTELCLMAADTPDDVRRLLSLQLSAAWVEEAREIDEEVFKGLLGRVDRFPTRVAGGVGYPGVICSTNAPALNTFWHRFISAPPTNAKVFVQPEAILEDLSINPAAENLMYLGDDYYPNLMAANSEEWRDVYLRNMFGQGNAGQAVYRSTFKKSFHVAEDPLLTVPGLVNPLVVGMDNGLQAAATVMQQDPRGRVNVLSECYVPEDETMGVETFLDRMLIPHLTAKYPVRREMFLFVLDPACFIRSQVNEATIAQAVQARGFKVLKGNTNDPDKRQQAMEGLLTRAIDGKAGILFDKCCPHLIAGMEWGYRYKKLSNGQTTTLRDKTHHSHTCFVAGTHVATPQGHARIEDLRVDDYVLTPAGARRVTATMNRLAWSTLHLQFDTGVTVECTPDHPFISTQGIVLADAVSYGMILRTIGELTCQEDARPPEKPACLSGGSSTPPQTGTGSPAQAAPRKDGSGHYTGQYGSWPTAPYLLAKLWRSLTAIRAMSPWATSASAQEAQCGGARRLILAGSGTTENRPGTTNPIPPQSNTCTERCGRAPTALSRTKSTSTTWITTAATTLLETWKRWTAEIILRTTCGVDLTDGGGSPSPKPSPLQQSGTATPLTATRTSLRESSLGSAENPLPKPAATAAPCLTVSLPPRRYLSSARPNAAPRPADSVLPTIQPNPAQNAAPSSQRVGTQVEPTVARLVGKREDRGLRRVYDLTVDEQHVFYANGMLVHNCESAEYAASYFNAQVSQTSTAFMTRAHVVKPRPYAYV